jgi:pSer/pThr/pTyr-binding forkhead associated (FHA) protein
VAKIILSIDDKVLREITISRKRITIGRRAHNDVVIDDIAVSAEHAVIVTVQGDYVLEDLNSTNGTQVNGQPVKRHFLQNHDVIDLARYKIRFIAEADDDADDAFLSTVAQNKPGHVARIAVLNGANAGKEIGLTKTLTTIGRPGMQVAAVTHRPQGYCITHVEGDVYPLINGQAISAGSHSIKHGDVIDLSGTHMKFVMSN